jgi:4'-phosphopantetheinyl transferase
LSPREQRVLAGLHVFERRRDWMLGRWAAKRALRAAGDYLSGNLDDLDDSILEIIAAPDGAPEAWIEGRRAPVTISLSHRGGTGACLLAGVGMLVGCDLELVEPRAPVFAGDWFTEGELQLVAGARPEQRDLVVTLIWSAKESVLKAVRQGLRLDPRDVEVRLAATDLANTTGGTWRSLTAAGAGRLFEGWWRVDDRMVMTAVMDPAHGSPAPVNRLAAFRRA